VSDEIDLTRGLHAKCYVIDAGWKAHVFTGSANATRAGFNGNVELLVELVGPRSKFGIDALFRREEGKTCLGDLLEEFRPQARTIDEEQEGARAEIERTRQLLAASGFAATVSSSGDLFTLAISATDSSLSLEPDIGVQCWPVTLGQGWAREIGRVSGGASFENLSLEALTSFIAFEVTTREPERSEVFVLNVPLLGAPFDRRERLLRSFIKDRQRLMRFLLFLLADDAELADAMGTKRGVPGTLADAEDVSRSNGALLETLLRTLHRSPERLDAVARLVDDVRRQPDAADLLPPSFEQIWEPIWAARAAMRVSR
jgi:hypothetical protein